jgi:molybdate transport repressor ModE-like protein
VLKVKLEPNLRVGRATLYPVPPALQNLLQCILRHGSLVEAARQAGISYRKANRLLDEWEAITGAKLAQPTQRKGTGLTELGARVAGIPGWLQPRLESAFAQIEGELEHYLGSCANAAQRQRVIMRASNDVGLAKLKERLDRHLTINLAFTGSLTCLDALAASECDIAGFHVPDPPSLLGSLLNEFSARLNTREHFVVCLYSRFQGLMYARKRGPRVSGLRDVARLGLRFANREPGSGTRLLLDALLEHAGIDTGAINGYANVKLTHMATARAVRNGTADIALGIEAAARAHDLAFLPLVTEHYYLACRRRSPARIAIDTIVANARSPAFARAIARIGGYDLGTCGSERNLGEILKPADRIGATTGVRMRCGSARSCARVGLRKGQ